MERFIIRTTYPCREKVEQIGKIVFESTVLEGVYGIETYRTKKELESLSFVEHVEEDALGTFAMA